MSFKSPSEHRESIVEEFVSSYRSKYDRGQSEHGGSMWENGRDNLTEAKNEALDLVSYLFTADWQRRQAIAAIEEFLGNHAGDHAAPLRRALCFLKGEVN